MAILYSLYRTCASFTRNSWKHIKQHARDCSSVRNIIVFKEKIRDVVRSGKKLCLLVSLNVTVCIVRL